MFPGDSLVLTIYSQTVFLDFGAGTDIIYIPQMNGQFGIIRDHGIGDLLGNVGSRAPISRQRDTNRVAGSHQARQVISSPIASVRIGFERVPVASEGSQPVLDPRKNVRLIEIL